VGEDALLELAYARVSRPSQSVERQIINITAAYPAARIFRETYTGTRIEGRKIFNRLLKLARQEAKAGKKVRIIFDSVSRMSRSAQEGFETYRELSELGVDLVFLKEPQINTSTYREALERQISLDVSSGDSATDELIHGISEAINRYILRLAEKQIYLAFAQSQKEVDDLRKKTREGLMIAKAEGKRIGTEPGRKMHVKKAGPAKKMIRKYSKNFEGSLPDVEVIKLAGISRTTYYKYKRELLEEETVP